MVVSQVPRTNVGLAGSLRLSISRLARRMRHEQVDGDHLTFNQVSTLGALSRHGAMTVGDLAEVEKVQPPSMTRIVNCLADKGLVARHQHPSDRRAVMVELTDTAEEVLRAARHRKEAWLHQRLRELTPAERQILREAAPILERLSRA